MSRSDRSIVRSSEEHAAEAPLHSGVGISRRDRARSRDGSPHAHKFLLATAVLTGIAVAAVAIMIALLLSPSSRSTSFQWSSWSPPDSGIAGEREIADEIAPLYRASPANQLAVVTIRNISGTANSGDQLALRDPNNGSLGSVSGNTAVFTLCGLGPNCAIAAGAPSTARLLLLRREALELALYTFKYVHGIQNVVTILPPGHTEATARLTQKPPSPGQTTASSPIDLAVVFQRNSLGRFLSAPLRAALPEDLPPTVTQMSGAPEAELVSVVTGQALFTQQLVKAQDGSSVLVLNPVPPQ
jgi:hypothetical protein